MDKLFDPVKKVIEEAMVSLWKRGVSSSSVYFFFVSCNISSHVCTCMLLGYILLTWHHVRSIRMLIKALACTSTFE